MVMPHKTDIKSLNYNELVQYVESINEKKFRAAQLYSWMHEKLAESLLKTWTREDRTDPYNTLEMTNLRIQADMEVQKQVMEEIIHPRIG